MGDGVAERIKASVATCNSHRRRFDTLAMGGFFLRGSHGVRKEVPPSPTMADTYGCPLKNLPKTDLFTQNHSSIPTVPKTNNLCS